MKPCACGCGGLIEPIDKRGRPHFYMIGHATKTRPIRNRPSGESHYLWKGGRIHTHGYIRILKRDHPFCNKYGYVYEHRLVMEEHLGRYLDPNEVVHHKNKIRTDNRIENLELFSDNGKHLSMEFKFVKH